MTVLAPEPASVDLIHPKPEQTHLSPKVGLIAFALFAALSILWSLASPIFSVPDENAHATKAIAQLRGEIMGHHVTGVRQPVVDLPPSYSYQPQILCFAQHPEIPADCGVAPGDGGTKWFATWVGGYNPIYYYLVGWPSLFLGGSAGVYGMRIVSGLLGAAFLAVGFQAAMAARRARWMPLGMAFVASPMVLYLTGAINPNGVEIAAAVALWASLLRLLEWFGSSRAVQANARPSPFLWIVVTLSAIFLTNARALGPLWLVVVVAVCFVAVGWLPVKRLFLAKRSYPWLAVIAVGAIFSLSWTLIGGSLSGQAEKGDAPLVGASFIQGFAYMLRGTVSFARQAMGYFGWFDAPMPDFALWVIIVAIAIVVVLGFTAVGRRGVLTLSVLAAAALLVPALVQAYSVHQTGIIWQGRYGLFLYLGFPIIAGWLLSRSSADRVAFLSVRWTWIGSGLIAFYGLLAFVLVLRRYVVGNDVPIGSMWKDPQWQPPLGWIALVVLYAIVSALFVVWLSRLAGRAVRAEDALLRVESL